MKKERVIQAITNGKCLVPDDAVMRLMARGYSQADAQRQVSYMIERVSKEPLDELTCTYTWDDLTKSHT